MNSLTARNAALFLIFYLLWFVFSGIYKNHVQQTLAIKTQIIQEQEIARDDTATHSPIVSPPVISTNSDHDSIDKRIIDDSYLKRTLTEPEIRAVMMTRKLPNWAKNSESKYLSLEEVEEIVSSRNLSNL